VPHELYLEARAAADRGDAAHALDLAGRAYESDREDADARGLYAALLVARGIRLSAAAREARRRAIVRRDIGFDEEFTDSPDVGKAFDEALEVLDRALLVEPAHPKAHMMKAALLFRRDRAGSRAVALEILRGVLAAQPENRQVLLEIRRTETPCERCSDTGFCPHCGGRGVKRFLRIESPCDACHAQGICLACGLV